MIREITASGPPRQLGREYGEAASDLIANVYELRMRLCSQGSTVVNVLDRAMAYSPFVKRYAPELLEEVRGIGEAAGIGFEQAFFLQVASELDARAEPGCSSLATSMSADGPIIAQNWDTSLDYLGNEIVVHLRPHGKPQAVLFAIAGVIGYVGLNEHGLGQVTNSLKLGDRRLGLTGYFMMRKFLEARYVEEALTWLQGVQIGSDGNYLIGDVTGTVVDVELGGGRVRLLRGPVQVHTNHYVAGHWEIEEKASAVLPDSCDRYLRLKELIGDGTDSAQVFGALKDHAGFPASVCRHEGSAGLATNASVVHNLGAREMLVCVGNPCRGEYYSFPVSRRSDLGGTGQT